MAVNSPVMTSPTRLVSTSVDDRAHALRRVVMFAGLSEAHRRTVAAASQSVQLRRSEVLFLQGTHPSAMYVVVSGVMELSLANADGDRKVLEIIGAGQSLGEAVLFLQRPFPVDARALAATSLVRVPASIIDELIDSDTGFARAMLASMSVRLHNRVRDIEMFTLATARQRVVGFLLGQLASAHDGAERHGECMNQPPLDAGVRDGGIVVLPASKATVASRLGMSPETLSRTLTELAQSGAVVVDGKRLTVPSTDTLAELAAV